MIDRWLTSRLGAAARAVGAAFGGQAPSRRRRQLLASEEVRRAREEAEAAVAERRRLEEALRRSQEDWERTFEGVPDLIALLDDQHRITRVNRAMARRLGRRPEGCVGLRCYEAVHGLTAPPEFCPHAKTLKDGREHTEELREERLGGDFIVTTSPLLGPRGQVVGSLHVARDITVRKRAEEQARRQYAVLSGMIRIFRQTLTARTKEELGATCLAVAEEVTGSRFAFLGDIDARAGRLDDVAMSDASWEAHRMEGSSGHGRKLPLSLEIQGLVGRVLKEGKSLLANDPASHPGAVGAPPGHPPLTAFLGVPLQHAGKTIGVMGLANREGGYGPEEVDAAEAIAAAVVQALVSKRAEEALRERAEEMETLMDLAPVAIWFSDDPECYRIVANREANRLFDGVENGDRPAGAATPARRYFQSGRELPADELPMRRAAARGVEVRDVELEVETVRGRRVAMLGSAAPLRDGAGRVRGSIAAFVDITARNRVEAERERLLAQVAEADRRKGEFLAVLSHELRNPLAPIRNSLYLLDHAPPGSERAARAREIIHRQTNHLTRLIDDLLDVTRISRGKIELQRQSIDVREVVRRACDDHRTSFMQRGLALGAEISGEPVWIDADETRIAQAVGNLLHNAGKFGREGGFVTVSVNMAGGQAEIRVRDDGIGIGPELLPRVFEPFVQGDECLARTRGGLGLGLALVKGLVELHGGSVQAHSDGPGRGAEFTIALPLGHAGAEQRPAVAAAYDDRQWRVLVIDDNRDETATLHDALDLSGHHVEVAHDGAEGLEKARAFKPDVVLCDIGLPGMDGYEVARAMRGDPALAAAKLVAVTGYARPEDVLAAREAGFDQHMAKPASIPDLERVVRGFHAALAAGADVAPPESAPPGARRAGERPPSRGVDGDREAAPPADMEVFISRASHDLRAPLRHIDAFSEALAQDCGAALGELGRNHLARIRLARSRAQEIIDDLVTLWQVGSAELVIEDVDLTALAGRVSSDLRRTEPWREVEIDLEEGVTARGDQRLLRVLFENLLGNAWKYTARQSSAHIEFGRAAAPSGVAYFVRDDGTGFDMVYAGKLFEPFQRLHAKGDFEGTGLGLHMVRRVAERHGGRAWVESAPGRGTTVHFTLGGET
jgi:PAS domain S-box-containing protein